jgi:hypothetical protein
MLSSGYREEVLNVILALLLSEHGIASAPEQSLRRILGQSRQVPDVLVDFHGLTTVLEGKVADHPNADTEVLLDARRRVEGGIAHIGIAILYPAELRSVAFPDLRDSMSSANLQVAVVSEAGETGWTRGNVYAIAELLSRTMEQMVQEDVVARAGEALQAAVDRFAQAALHIPSAPERLAQVLGIRELPRSLGQRDEAEKDELGEEQ